MSREEQKRSSKSSSSLQIWMLYISIQVRLGQGKKPWSMKGRRGHRKQASRNGRKRESERESWRKAASEMTKLGQTKKGPAKKCSFFLHIASSSSSSAASHSSRSTFLPSFFDGGKYCYNFLISYPGIHTRGTRNSRRRCGGEKVLRRDGKKEVSSFV